MVIVVASDQHLGYANSNSEQFEGFLDDLSKRNDVTDFVILGDFVDMWRRDISGLFLEQHKILEKVLDLKSKMRVYCVAGNHDFHLLKLTNHQYPLEFIKELTIPSDEITYTFKHGWEFDLAQQEPIMELLCYNISDESGQLRSDFWDVLTRTFGNDILNSLEGLFERHKDRDNYLQYLQTPPQERLQQDITDVEKRACSSVKDGEILIFGHTHRPFVNTANNVVNSGSWVSDATITNTYVELDGSTIHLMQYGAGEITKREDCPTN
jgi:UDP-2,3-diacylglucosamine pyrophosphatase LpxH